MKILLAALNAKYIHSSPAVYSLQAYSAARGIRADVAEYTINHDPDRVLAAIYRQQPQLLCFSCYIWNLDQICRLAEDFHTLCPEVPVWAGGPEVSYGAEQFLADHPVFTGVICGEGEASFTELARAYAEGRFPAEAGEIRGLAYRTEKGILSTGARPPVPMDDLPFLYDDPKRFENRIVYYESSRGCPFSCSYCLSSADRYLRERSLDLVLPELQFFLDRRIPQVKFTDRTFNCRPERAMAIWQYLLDHDNGVTNFHFEVAADLLTEEELELLERLRPGQVQFEIGIQTTNPETIREIRRSMDLGRVRETCGRLRKGHNIHMHLDLIAGLPKEDFDRFGRSFDDIYRWYPEQLQLGFLKLLKGSYMHEKAADYGMRTRKHPPYEVLETRWLSYEELLQIHRVEEMLEIYYNSGQYPASIRLAGELFERPFIMFQKLADHYEKAAGGRSTSRQTRAEILLDFLLAGAGAAADTAGADNAGAAETDGPAEDVSEDRPNADGAKVRTGGAGGPDREELSLLCRQAVLFDLYSREKLKKLPAWYPAPDREEQSSRQEYLRIAGLQSRYVHLERLNWDLPAYRGADLQAAGGRQLPESFPEAEGRWFLFDYEERDPLTGMAGISALPAGQEV